MPECLVLLVANFVGVGFDPIRLARFGVENNQFHLHNSNDDRHYSKRGLEQEKREFFSGEDTGLVTNGDSGERLELDSENYASKVVRHKWGKLTFEQCSMA